MPAKYNHPRFYRGEMDDIDILLRERLAVFSAASKESDIMEQVLSKVNMGLIAFGYL